MSEKGCSGIHEDSHKDRNERKREDVDAEIEIAMLHHERHHNREYREESIEHGDASGLGEIVPTEQTKVTRKGQHKNEDIQYVADKIVGYLRFGSTASLHFLFQRCKYAVIVFGHHIAHTDNLLSTHHHSAGGGNPTEQVVHGRFSAFLVVYEVGLNIIIEV